MWTILNNDWDSVLRDEFKAAYYKGLQLKLSEEYNKARVYPDKEDIFNALKYTSYEATKVVLLGQDPYHGPGQAHGLSFSVKLGIKPPPSLKNIFKELNSDLGYCIPTHGFLEGWAKEGVLLLNTVLTVREGEPNSHKGFGWEQFTDKIISLLNKRQKPVVFVLWGNYAQAKESLISEKQHHVIKAPHPSPLSASRGFFGSKPFSSTNRFLEATGMAPINWRLEDINKY